MRSEHEAGHTARTPYCSPLDDSEVLFAVSYGGPVPLIRDDRSRAGGDDRACASVRRGRSGAGRDVSDADKCPLGGPA
jgi:hypothetical protein